MFPFDVALAWVLHNPAITRNCSLRAGGIRFEERETPKILDPGDAIIRIAVTCV